MPSMPWDFARTRADAQVNPSAEGVIQEAGAYGRQAAQLAYQGRADLGAGIARGLETVTHSLEAAKARADDPSTAYRRMMLERQDATDQVIRGTTYPTAEEHYGGPPGPGGAPSRPIPPIEQSASHLWSRMSDRPYDKLDPVARGRLGQIVGQLQQTRFPMYEDSPQMRAAMAKADPSAVAELKTKGFTKENFAAGLEKEFRSAVYGDSVLQQALIKADMEEAPMRRAQAAGRMPLAKTLEGFRGNLEAQKVAEALWPAFESHAPFTFNDEPMTLGQAAALSPEISLEQVKALTGQMTVAAPSVMVDEKGRIQDDPARRNAWLKGQGDKEPYLSSMGHKSWREQIFAGSVFEQGREVLGGLQGRGKYALSMSSDAKEKWVNQSMKGLVEKYGEAAISGLVARRLLNLPGSDEQVLGDRAPQAKEISAAFQTVFDPVLKEKSALIGGISPHNSALWGQVVKEGWQSQLSGATMMSAGPLMDYQDVAAPVLQQVWKGFGESIRNDIPWQELEKVLRGRGLSGMELTQHTAAAYSEFESHRKFMEASWPTIDDKGREWEAVPPKEKERILRTLGDTVVENLFHLTDAPRPSPDGRELLPKPQQPAPLSSPKAQAMFDRRAASGLLDRTGIIDVPSEDGYTYTYRDGKFERASETSTGKTASDPSKDEYGPVKEQAFAPAQDVYRSLKSQMGMKAPAEAWLYYQGRLPHIRAVSPIVEEVLGQAGNRLSLYRQVQEILESGKGTDLRTGYDAVLYRLAEVADKNNLFLGNIKQEFDAVAAREPAEPVISAIAVLLEQAFSGTKDGFDNRQLDRTSPNLQQMFPDAFKGPEVDAGVRQPGDPDLESPPNSGDMKRRRAAEAESNQQWDRGERLAGLRR